MLIMFNEKMPWSTKKLLTKDQQLYNEEFFNNITQFCRDITHFCRDTTVSC